MCHNVIDVLMKHSVTVQHRKTLTAKPDNHRWRPGMVPTQQKERTDSHRLPFDLHFYATVHVCPHTINRH